MQQSVGSAADELVSELYSGFLEEMTALRAEAYCRELALEWDNISWSYGLKLIKPCFALTSGVRDLGAWDPTTRTISLSHEAIERLSWDSVLGLLKHEMAHQFVDESLGGHGCEPHGKTFAEACDRLGLNFPFRRAHLQLDDLWERGQRAASLPDRLRRRMERLEALAERGACHEAGVAQDLLKKLRNEFAEHLVNDGLSPESKGYTTQTIDLKRRRASRHHAAAAGLIARHFGVEVIFSSCFDVGRLERSKTLVVLGRHDRVEMAVFAFQFVVAEADRAWRSARSRGELEGRDVQSFRLGVVVGFDESLSDGARSSGDPEGSEGGDGDCAALVRSSGERRALARFVATQFPRISSSTWGNGRERSQAMRAGKDAGRALSMPKPLQHQTGGVQRLLKG